ncbi:hypothetical protein HNQ81_003002 [Desulfoprunum benzoelyticum]|uniref:Uncharacterized protein n=1 Tax=Desulfoprunum benzoelyticum TaxID=1506996 RepID=A0A840V5R2_9BACT|nr:hypothetical protein [Desulfoprunum benzoelyticum]MBB5349250.1 hypothetical protein [Desulfoprunum benzoelyticum]
MSEEIQRNIRFSATTCRGMISPGDGRGVVPVKLENQQASGVAVKAEWRSVARPSLQDVYR